MTAWEKLDDVSKSIAEEPGRLYWREMKSGTRPIRGFSSRSLASPGKVV